MPRTQYVSFAVIRRLPRYYRFLGELLENGTTRTSSKELAQMMGLTASQIRQDLNCFGGFGQQGYGYNVAGLYAEIHKILGLDQNFRAVLIGAGNLGHAFANHIDFEMGGFHLTAIFDKNPEVIGQTISGLAVRDIATIEDYCRSSPPHVAILCIPKEDARLIADRLIACGVSAFWNFSHYDLALEHPNIIVENTQLVDGLMALCYQINDQQDNGVSKTQ